MDSRFRGNDGSVDDWLSSFPRKRESIEPKIYAYLKARPAKKLE
jgi:hypothetical protein